MFVSVCVKNFILFILMPDLLICTMVDFWNDMVLIHSIFY